MTNTDGRSALGGLWNSIQSWLFPMLEDEIGELDAKHRQFVAVCELCALQNHMAAYHWIGNGCPPSDRLALCKAFIASFSNRRRSADGGGKTISPRRLRIPPGCNSNSDVICRPIWQICRPPATGAARRTARATPICTRSTADGMCAYAARSRSPPTWPLAWW